MSKLKVRVGEGEHILAEGGLHEYMLSFSSDPGWELWLVLMVGVDGEKSWSVKS
jgi:hypothetical protein